MRCNEELHDYDRFYWALFRLLCTFTFGNILCDGGWWKPIFFFHFAFIATMLSNLIRDTSWADFPSHMIINCVYNTQILSTVCEKGWACVAALLIRSPRGMCFEMLPVDDDYNIMYVRHVPWKTLHRLHNSNFNSFNIQMYCSYVHTLCICMHIEDYYYNLYYARTQNLWMCFNS